LIRAEQFRFGFFRELKKIFGVITLNYLRLSRSF